MSVVRFPLTFSSFSSFSGDLQSTLLAMKDSAYEASVALSAFGGIIRGHSALTSECGSMLEEVKFVSFNLLLRIVLSFESR